MADIQAMFNQVKVPTKDRDLLRFLWWPEGNISKPLEEFRMTTHLFGATSSPACANYALRCVAEEADEAVKDTVQKNFYVDDCLKSTSSEEQAIQLIQNLMEVLKQGGFNLTKWVSNSPAVMQTIPSSHRVKTTSSLDLGESTPNQKALGMMWLVESDELGFKIEIRDRPPTRRGILSVVSAIYDPLGFVSPVILPAKRILQSLCELQVSWDEPIPDLQRKQWDRWLNSIPQISAFTVPRCFVPVEFGKPTSVQLHHFSDASEIGYGMVSYLRFTNQRDDVHCALVLSKSRVAPLKQVTIPRLELTAATVAVKINHMIHKELEIQINDTIFWTDSTTVLQYIRSETKRFKTFVANRLAIIKDGSTPSQWRYVATSLNPADDCSRGLPANKFLENERWICGPQFLWKREAEWPQNESCEEMHRDDSEVRRTRLKKSDKNTAKVEEEEKKAVKAEETSSAEVEDEMRAVKAENTSSAEVEDEMRAVKAENTSSAKVEDEMRAVKVEDMSTAKVEDMSTAKVEDMNTAKEEEEKKAVKAEDKSSAKVEEEERKAVKAEDTSSAKVKEVKAVKENMSTAKEEEEMEVLEEEMKVLEEVLQDDDDPEVEKVARIRKRNTLAKKREGELKQAPQPSQFHLSVADLKSAEEAIAQYVQRRTFAKEIKVLENLNDQASKRKKSVVKSSPIYRLDPVLDNGILRVGGRLSLADISSEAKHPIILPKNTVVSDLILQDIHQNSGHSGRNQMLATLHEKFWIISANSSARKMINKCVICRRQRAKVMEQKMANLPSDRITPEEPPFSKVGMDFFGPLEVKQGRSMVKRYGVVFVCLTSKAVHIEKANSLDTDACVNVIRRFMARSDNGTNLVGAEREMRKEINTWNQSRIHDSMLQKNVDWIFNPPAGSHHGGIWERQIRTIRKLMCSIVREQTLTDDSLHTLLCEIESILNNRPITTVPGESTDPEPLTPNHILLLKGDMNLPPAVTGKLNQYAKRRWKQVQYMSDLF
ncbi:uncharacterized protein [Amphiura filiformis]|uniref:uncharacterized protein n=1 Tax=Amphiura filiformis TaxID=82378 RepID=UPI003B215483